MKKERDSGIELLRIITMLMVIGVHLFLYGKFYDTVWQNDGVSPLLATGIKLFFRSAVNIFIIISGYFCVTQSFDLNKSFKRIFKLYLPIIVYSVAFSIIALSIGQEARESLGIFREDLNIILKMFFPITSQTWYFLTDYIFLMLLSPFINIALNGINKKQYKVLLAILGFILSVWLMFGNLEFFSAIANKYGHEGLHTGKNIFSFIFMYIIGGYIKLHCKQNPRPKVRYLLFVLISLLTNCGLSIALDKLIGYNKIFFVYANPFVILVAVFMFMFFKDLHFKSRIINLFASTTLGVYAISEFWLIRAWLWKIFDFSKGDCSNVLINILMVLLVSVIVFVGCGTIDLLRQKVFLLIEKLFKNKNN